MGSDDLKAAARIGDEAEYFLCNPWRSLFMTLARTNDTAAEAQDANFAELARNLVRTMLESGRLVSDLLDGANGKARYDTAFSDSVDAGDMLRELAAPG